MDAGLRNDDTVLVRHERAAVLHCMLNCYIMKMTNGSESLFFIWQTAYQLSSKNDKVRSAAGVLA